MATDKSELKFLRDRLKATIVTSRRREKAVRKQEREHKKWARRCRRTMIELRAVRREAENILSESVNGG